MERILNNFTFCELCSLNTHIMPASESVTYYMILIYIQVLLEQLLFVAQENRQRTKMFAYDHSVLLSSGLGCLLSLRVGEWFLPRATWGAGVSHSSAEEVGAGSSWRVGSVVALVNQNQARGSGLLRYPGCWRRPKPCRFAWIWHASPKKQIFKKLWLSSFFMALPDQVIRKCVDAEPNQVGSEITFEMDTWGPHNTAFLLISVDMNWPGLVMVSECVIMYSKLGKIWAYAVECTRVDTGWRQCCMHNMYDYVCIRLSPKGWNGRPPSLVIGMAGRTPWPMQVWLKRLASRSLAVPHHGDGDAAARLPPWKICCQCGQTAVGQNLRSRDDYHPAAVCLEGLLRALRVTGALTHCQFISTYHRTISRIHHEGSNRGSGSRGGTSPRQLGVQSRNHFWPCLQKIRNCYCSYKLAANCCIIYMESWTG